MELQYNHITGHEYQGHNLAALLSAKAANNYNSNAWLTFLQAKAAGLSIRKGSYDVGILSTFLSGSETTTKDGKTIIEKKSFIPRHYTVFNFEQTEMSRVPELVPAISV